MCGIVGAVSARNIVPVLVEGLKRLEYRGYDSCGVAVHQDGELRRTRSTARVAELAAQIDADHVASGTGIGHTRWATHGAPAVHNAHPHFSGAPATTAVAPASAAAPPPSALAIPKGMIAISVNLTDPDRVAGNIENGSQVAIVTSRAVTPTGRMR